MITITNVMLFFLVLAGLGLAVAVIIILCAIVTDDGFHPSEKAFLYFGLGAMWLLCEVGLAQWALVLTGGVL